MSSQRVLFRHQMPRCRVALSVCVFYINPMSWNPYVNQIAAQQGMTEWEARRECRRPTVITDAEARRRGYTSAAAYEEALHDFLNSN